MKTNLSISDTFVLMAGIYETLFPIYDATMLQDAHDAITQCELWDWMLTFDATEGFAACNHPNIEKIRSKLKYSKDGDASFAWCMENMKMLVEMGWAKYSNYIVSARLKESESRFNDVVKVFASSPDPEKRKQADAMDKFKKGELSYAEMRSLCG